MIMIHLLYSFLILLYNSHFLEPSIDILKTHQAAREYIQNKLKTVYQAYVQNDIQIVVLSGL